MINRSRIAALLIVTAAFSALLSVPALAQKPALTQNVDEKGRTPFHQTLSLNLNASSPLDCSTNSCNVVFSAVPAGYRLVITYVFAGYTAIRPAIASNSVLVGTPATEPTIGNVVENFLYLPIATPDAFGFCVTSTPVTLYVDAGANPTMYIQNIVTGPSAIAEFSIEGYLVNLSQ
jgi:hypothetical protein